MDVILAKTLVSALLVTVIAVFSLLSLSMAISEVRRDLRAAWAQAAARPVENGSEPDRPVRSRS